MAIALYQIFIFIGLGYIAKSIRMLSPKQSGILLTFLLNFSLPSVIFLGVYYADINMYLLGIIALALLCNLSSAFLIYFIAIKLFKLDRFLALSIWFLVAISNTFFMGVPLVQGALGAKMGPIAIIYDQFATGLPLAIIAPLLISTARGAKFELHSIAIRLFKNPLFLSLLSGLVLKVLFYYIDFKIPVWILSPMEKLALCAAPLALFSIGVQLKVKELKNNLKLSLFIVLWSMLVSAGIFFAISSALSFEKTDIWKMALMQVAMPPLTSSVAVLAQAKLNMNLAISCITLGTLFSVAIIPFWVYISSL